MENGEFLEATQIEEQPVGLAPEAPNLQSISILVTCSDDLKTTPKTTNFVKGSEECIDLTGQIHV